ncbi:MAG: ribonuclease P protein component [Cellulophaga sp.]
MLDFSFSKKEKLKSKKRIEQLFSEGKSISVYPIRVLYLKTNLPEGVTFQTGVTVPKRNFKSAVKRNQIKRLLRESYRLNKHLIFNNLKGNYTYMFLYLGKEIPLFHSLEKSMVAVMKKLILKESHEKIN